MKPKEVIKFLKNNCGGSRDLNDINENKDGSFDINRTIHFHYADNLKKMPFKINHLKGGLFINNVGLETVENFPKICEGSIQAKDNKFKTLEGWEVEKVNYISISSENISLENLNDLYETDFKGINISSGETHTHTDTYSNNHIFSSNKVYEKHKKYLGDSITIDNKLFKEMIKSCLVFDKSISFDEYLEDIFEMNDLEKDLN